MIAIVLLCLAPSEVPHVVTLNAVLEEDGAAVDRTVDAAFVLWDHERGGTAVWSEADTVAVRSGVLVADLGLRRALPAEVFTRALWLEISIDGQALSPRSRIASVPYAYAAEHADEADTLDGLGVDDLATRAALREPGGAKVSYQNLVDVPAGVPLYQELAACDTTRRLTLSAVCVPRPCTTGARDCAGACGDSGPGECENELVGTLGPP